MARRATNTVGDYFDAVRVLGVPEDDAATRERIAGLLGLHGAPPTQSAPLKPPEFPSPTPHPLPPSRGQQRKTDESRREVPTPNHAWIETRESGRRRLPAWYRSTAALPPTTGTAPTAREKLEPLLAPARTRAVLAGLLETATEDGDLDLERLIEPLSRAKPITTFPRLVRYRFERGVDILMDTDEALQPFARDRDQLLNEIRRLFPGDRIAEYAFSGCPLHGVYAPLSLDLKPYVPKEPGRLVLIIADLGAARAVVHRTPPLNDWRAFVDRMVRTASPVVALVPFDVDRVPRALRRIVSVVPWDRTTTSSRARLLRRRFAGRLA